VSAFALVGDAVRPKFFAGLFGAAPSITLATLGLTVATEGRDYAAIEARSMITGAIAFFIYALIVSKVMFRYKPPTLAQLPQLEGQVFCFQRGYPEVFTTSVQIRRVPGFAGRAFATGLPDVRWDG
jgi:hypothetical protein